MAWYWIVWTLYSETTPCLSNFYGSVDYKKGFICESFSFVVVYLVVGVLTKTLIVPAVFIVSQNVLHRSNHKNISFPRIYDMFSFLFFEFLSLTTLPCHH